MRQLHEHDEGDDHDRHDHEADDEGGRQRAGAAELERRGERVRQVGDDAGHDDQRDAVADAARGDLLAEPHQKHGAAGQRHRRGQAEEQAGIEHRRMGAGPHAFEPDGDPVGLDQRQQHGAVAGILVELALPALALLFQRLEARGYRRQQLDDDRGRNIRHDVQGENRHAPERAAREHVEHAENAAGVLREDLIEDGRVDAGDRDVGAKPVHHQRTQREPDAAFELGRLCEGGEVEAGGELFGG